MRHRALAYVASQVSETESRFYSLPAQLAGTGDLGPRAKMAAGLVAGATACTATYPLEALRWVVAAGGGGSRGCAVLCWRCTWHYALLALHTTLHFCGQKGLEAVCAHTVLNPDSSRVRPPDCTPL